MGVFDTYKTAICSVGNTERERIINRAKYDLNTKALKSPACKEVLVNGEKRFVIMKRSDNFGEIFINCMPDETVKLGDYVEWKNGHYIVSDSKIDDDISLRATIIRCNRIFRWQDPKTLSINERWAAMYRPYSSSSFGDKVIQISNREFKVYVPYDKDTANVSLGTRFLLEDISGEPKVYEITTIDVNSKVFYDEEGGYIVWNVQQAQYNPDNDNSENRISNYKEPCGEENKNNNEENISATIKYLGNDTLKINGSYKRFSYEFIDNASNEIIKDLSNEDISWNVEYENSEYISVTIDSNNDLKIKIIQGATPGSIVKIHLLYKSKHYAQLQLKVVNII